MKGATLAVRELLKKHPKGLSLRAIVDSTGIAVNRASSTLGQMNDVAKTGERGAYV